MALAVWVLRLLCDRECVRGVRFWFMGSFCPSFFCIRMYSSSCSSGSVGGSVVVIIIIIMNESISND